jgi:hypothetical protein
MTNGRLRTSALVVLVAALTLLPPVASADSPFADTDDMGAAAGPVEVETVSTVDSGNETTVTVRYETTVTAKINTYLFGSEELEERIVEAVGVEEEHVEFESLDTESAEILYDGEADVDSNLTLTPS